MGLKASNVIVSLLIFAALVTLLSTFYVQIQTNYTQIPANTTEDNVLQQLEDLNIQNDVNETITGFQKLLAPDSLFDVLGGLKAATTGGFETLKTLFTSPIKVLEIANTYLHIPAGVIAILGIILFVYIAFILINIKTQGDN